MRALERLEEELLLELQGWEDQGRARSLSELPGPPDRVASFSGRSLVNWCSNDYLGLASEPRVVEAARQAAREYGTGAGASRLIVGDRPVHRELERELASWKGQQAALVFPTGYAAALGLLGTLAAPGDLILSDQLNHACLIDGMRLTRAEVRVFRHADVSHARELLADRDQYRRVLVVTDGVFSMDGDVAPLADLAELADSKDCFLVVDDAHGTGVLGATGSGSLEASGVPTAAAIQMGTLSKALGSQGGFVVGSETLIRLLVHRARSFVYSTGLAPPAAAAALQAARIARHEPTHRLAAHETARLVRGNLKSSVNLAALILPIVVGGERETLAASRRLRDLGHLVLPVRPPTVPIGTSRLRICVSARHTKADAISLAVALMEDSGLG